MNTPEPNLPLASPTQPELPAPVPPLPPSHRYPEDIDTPWEWADIFLLVGFTVLAAFVVGNLLSLAFVADGVSRDQLMHSSREQSQFILATQALLYIAILVYFYLRIEIIRKLPFWETLGWRPIETGALPRRYAYVGFVFLGSVLCLIVTAASGAYGTKAKLPIQELFQDRKTAMWFVLMAVLIAPVVEEIVFRGYLYPVVARTFGIGWSVVITGSVFGLMHAQQLWGGWLQIGLLVIVGIVLTYVRAITRTVTASYLLHLGYNSFIALAFLFTPEGYRALPWH
jgi:uncharacterized protein